MVSLYDVKHQGSGSKHKTREQSGFLRLHDSTELV
jgi:hypothetical protein